MLALAMATITRPKLFLIDELSLGLSPIVVEQLLGAIESMRQAGTAILLVEQSMNVAVAVADRVYVMETGVVRFSGTADELAAHPELLWSIYLQKASETLGAPGRSAAPAAATGRAELEVRGISLSFGGNAALDDVSLHADHGEIVGIIGPNGAGKTTLFDVVSGFLRPDAGRVELAGVDVTDRTASARARLGLGRSFQDSRLFSGLTVRDALAVSLERFTDVSDPFNAMLRLPLQVRTEAAVMRAGGRAARPVRPRPLRRQPGERAVDRLPAPRRPGRRGGPPAVRRPARRALLGRGPARGRGHGRPAAQRAGPARRHPARRRARHRLHRRAGRPPGGHGPRRRARQRAAARRPRVARWSARPSSAPTRSPCRARAPPATRRRRPRRWTPHERHRAGSATRPGGPGRG